METWQIAVLLLIGVGLVAGSILLRIRYGDRYALTPVDLILLVVPLLAALLLSGRLKELEMFGMRVPLSETFVMAASGKITSQVKPINFEPLETAFKSSLMELPILKKKRIEGLVFRLGGSYAGRAISEYLKTLREHPEFRYFIIEEPNGKFFGLYNVRMLEANFNPEMFAYLLNHRKKKQLKELPGFIGAEKAVAQNASRRTVLQQMEKWRLDVLPVVDKEGHLVGTVERSHVVSSLLLDVLEQLNKEKH